MDGYVPQSPDLSALHHPPALHNQQSDQSSVPALHTRESFSLPDSAKPSWDTQSPLTSQPHLKYPPSYEQHPYHLQSSYGSSQLKREYSDLHSSSNPYSQPAAMPPTASHPQPPQPPLPVIKTKFPIARIKRIVQADEDVGKVAQATPVAVSRALEQFMISLARKSADEARSRGSKKVTAADMKTAISNSEQFDFLSEIAERIPDAPTRKSKVESDSEDDAGASKPGRKRKAAGTGGRRKKVQDDSDDT